MSPAPSPPALRLRIARSRLLILVLGLLLTSLFVFGVVLVGASSLQVRRELESSLERTANSFRSTRSRELEQLTREGELLSGDPRLQQYREALRLTGPEFADYRTLREALRKHLRDSFGSSAGDVLLLVDGDGRVQLALQRPTLQPQAQAPVEPSEATSEAEATATEPLPPEGRELAVPLVDNVFQDGLSRAGYLRLEPRGALYEAAAVPLLRGAHADGVLVVARRITENTLKDWGQGMPDGVVVVVSEGEILAAHDRRVGRRPSPAMAASLEAAVSRWSPPESPGGPSEEVTVERLDLGGREWRALAVVLGGGGNRAAGWALFLGDSSGQEDRITRAAWLLAETGLGVLALAFLITWLAAGWVVSPLAEDEEAAER